MRRLSLTLALLFANISICFSDNLFGTVISVHDGDTLTLLVSGNQQLKIRLSQIDAPESDQPFGQKSRQSLANLVFNKNVQIEKETVDKYGRTVGTIFLDSIDVNREQIKQGMAWAYRQYLHDQSLIQDEEMAKQAKIGLWSDPNPMPPWEYRHTRKSAKVDKSFGDMPSSQSIDNSNCANKRYCKEMASCDEAKYYLTQCGLSRLDGDGDGIPCEKLCQ